MADHVAGRFVMGLLTGCFLGGGYSDPEPSWVYGLINAVAVLNMRAHVLWD